MTQETCSGPRIHRIIIARQGNFVVRPGRLVVRRGDTVVWLALGAKAHIFIPKKELFEGRVLDVADATDRIREGSIPNNISDSDLQKLLHDGVVNGFVVPDNAPYGIYPYSIFCDTPNAFAEGGSDPELIVGY
jgi:hypothetical protein